MVGGAKQQYAIQTNQQLMSSETSQVALSSSSGQGTNRRLRRLAQLLEDDEDDCGIEAGSRPRKVIPVSDDEEPSAMDSSSISPVVSASPPQLDPAGRVNFLTSTIVKEDLIRRGRYKTTTTEFPRTVITSKNRRFQKSWLDIYLWLEYSDLDDAAYCFSCQFVLL